jgi:hypothetical protein
MIVLLLKLKRKHVQQERKQKKFKDNMGLKIPYLNLTSQIPINDRENITREQMAKENIDVDDARKIKRLQM